MNKNRLILLDTLRGIAVFAMVIFHYYFYLIYLEFGILGLYEFKSFAVDFIGNIIRIIFLCLVGVSFKISFLNAKKDKNLFLYKQSKRLFLISFFAFLYSLITFFILNDYMIYWGVLHLISFSLFFLIISFFSRILFILLILFSLLLTLYIPLVDSIFFGSKILFSSLDFFPLYPWILLVFFGFFVSDFVIKFLRYLENKFVILKYKNFFSYLGVRSLLIYLLHMPIFALVIYVLKKI